MVSNALLDVSVPTRCIDLSHCASLLDPLE